MRIFAAFMLCLVAASTQAQETELQKVLKQASFAIDNFKENHPQEKVFLQTDRSYYAAGETVWMKAWLTLDGRPSYLSKILYVDLINTNGEVLDKKMYKVDSLSSAAGDVLLNSSLPTGNYQLRAYSLWMLNFKEFIYTTNIFVVGANNVKPAPVKNNITLSFFPEGGDLVNGLESAVSFKAYDQNGNGIAVQGSIVDAEGKIITSISTLHDGMGVFSLTPVEGKTYIARIETAPGSSRTFKIPPAKAEGIVLKVNNSSPSRLFAMVSKNTADNNKYNKLLVVAQMHNTIVYKGEVNFDEGATAASIAKKNLPPGIMQITIFDQAGTPLAERLVFIKNSIQTSQEIIVKQGKLSPKGKMELSVQTTGLKNPNVSISVIDAYTDSISTNEGIIAALLLTSDLKGKISNPNYYFQHDDSTTNKNLDLLLMSHGWRRFVWQDIMANKMPSLTYPVESAITIKGKVTKPGGYALVTEGKVNLVIKTDDSATLLSEAIITDKGEFIVGNLDLKKAASVAYQGTNSKKEKQVVDVNLYANYIDSLKKTEANNIQSDYSRFLVSKSLQDYLNKQANYFDSLSGKETLANVTVRAKRLMPIDSLNKEYATGLFEFGGRKIDAGNKGYFSVWQLIKNVPGFLIEGDPKNPNVSLSRTVGINVFSDNTSATQGATFADGEGNAASTSLETHVENGIAFYLNEVPVSRDVLDNLSMDDIAFVKTYVGAESGQIGPYNGVIAVYTQKGKAVGSSVLDKVFAKTKISGYAITREFFSPNYDLNPDAKYNADNRITLFWKPTLNFNKEGKANIEFFNNDVAKKVRIVVQGLDSEGRLIYKEQIIQ